MDKPLTWTSFNVVGKLRIALRIAAGRKLKVGHAGTLDPLATGLLILAYGPFTKKLPLITGEGKTYTGTLTLGHTTPSYDMETDPEDPKPWEHLDEIAVRSVLPQFIGKQMQRPPNFSAKRFEGERAYFLARDDERAHLLDMPEREVEITRLEITDKRGPEIDFVADVGKGTYIRSLAHDIGQMLGCGAYLSALRRTRIGEHHVADAKVPAEWSRLIAPE